MTQLSFDFDAEEPQVPEVPRVQVAPKEPIERSDQYDGMYDAMRKGGTGIPFIKYTDPVEKIIGSVKRLSPPQRVCYLYEMIQSGKVRRTTHSSIDRLIAAVQIQQALQIEVAEEHKELLEEIRSLMREEKRAKGTQPLSTSEKFSTK